eukprot:TRINITY_DN13120_c0_g1_i1.p2 TRINITY_DN13120_c0_g1~~TRINITY_DN13120_c0_g1_i1.p2  ORF type:complete len:223 (-),score=7.97 TRINITY_DN13120_c0_g1_i1:329-997(-)
MHCLMLIRHLRSSIKILSHQLQQNSLLQQSFSYWASLSPQNVAHKTAQQSTQQLKYRWRNLSQDLQTIIKAYCALHVFVIYVAELTICVGPSMLPTLGSRTLAIVDHTSLWFGDVEVGDVVLARSPDNPRKLICKRVIGVEGDIMNVPPAHFLGEYERVIVPKGRMWLQGDNFQNSTDSREYGPVPKALVCGKIIFKLWPLRLFGFVHNQVPDDIKEAYQLR